MLTSPMGGLIGVFSGATPELVVAPIRAIQVIEGATFSELNFMFPLNNPNTSPPQDITFPPLCVLENVKSFQLATGSVLVSFAGAVPPPAVAGGGPPVPPPT